MSVEIKNNQQYPGISESLFEINRSTKLDSLKLPLSQTIKCLIPLSVFLSLSSLAS